ncbi:hypothetical protein EV126DRAFT_414537 [Verticillium dahliae]|nr:hypothetical protein EV126DRAFT_414537 [Verticillium dahliae]
MERRWQSNGGTSTLVRIHKETGLETCFGNVSSAWGRSTQRGATEPPFRGDKSSITCRRHTATENRFQRSTWT